MSATQAGGREIRVFGPPGTGKTTWLAKKVRDTVRGRQTSRVMVGSFTRAAAAEIAGRGLPIPRDHVGTLHSLAYRAIGRPEVVVEHLDEWNERYPSLQMDTSWKGDLDQAPVERPGAKDGDVLLAELDVLRAKRVPRNLWRTQIQWFSDRWEEFKAEHECVDFTDMIELAIDNTAEAPGQPLVGFFDEVQDFTPLELDLVRHWGRRMDRIVLAGDDDQCIYWFKGSSPDAFLDPPVDDESKRVLAQSYRVPRAVHAASQAWVSQLARREPKVYLPRDDDGAVAYAEFRYRWPDGLVDDAAANADAGRSVMILASCGYMLDDVKYRLRDQGVPFHNPYRRSRGDWNPLRPSRGVSSAERVIAYLIPDEEMFGEMSRLWTGEDVRRWSAVVKVKGVFARGARGMIEGLPDRELEWADVARLFDDEEQLRAAVTPSLEWLEANLLAANQRPMEFPIRVARKRGPLKLLEEPKIVIGTIHSVKGGEADVVYLLPDLSMAGARDWDAGGEARDSIVRQFYVGMTRAREELIVCEPSSSLTVDLRAMIGG